MRPQPPKRVACEGESILLERVPRIGRINARYETGGQYWHRSRQGPRVRFIGRLTLGGEQATVWHELLHHAADRSGLSDAFSEVTVERILDFLDSWSLRLLQENPELVRYLMAEKP